MDLGLQGKFALVTGGTHGIGLATARALAGEGCHVAICSRTLEKIETAKEDLKTMGVEVLGIQADVLSPEAIPNVMKVIVQSWGKLHILVNNVGGGGRWGSASIEDTPEQVWWDVYSKNAMAAVKFTTLALPLMRKEKWGRVVTVSSIYGREGGGRPWFNMAKSAEISLMKSLSIIPEIVRDGVTFNSIAPGGIFIEDTGFDLEKKKDPQRFNQMLNLGYPLGRMGTPDEVASVIAFICSEKGSLINGSCIVVDGGQSRSF